LPDGLLRLAVRSCRTIHW